MTLFSHSPLLMPISLLEKNVPFVIILIALNMVRVYYQNNSTLSDVQKLSLLFSNKLCFVLDSGYLDVGCVIGSRTPVSGFFKK